MRDSHITYDVLYQSPDNAEPVSPDIWRTPCPIIIEYFQTTDLALSDAEHALLANLGQYGMELTALFERPLKIEK